MRGIVSSIILMLASTYAFAQVTSQPSPPCAKPVAAIPVGSNITLTWAPPTVNTDTTPITGTITYNLYNVTGANPVLLAGGLTSAASARTNLSAGTPCYAVTAVVGGVESGLSNTASVWVAEIPTSPKTVSCTITIPTGSNAPTAVCSTQ
jgi:hypothetical protein